MSNDMSNVLREALAAIEFVGGRCPACGHRQPFHEATCKTYHALAATHPARSRDAANKLGEALG